MKTTAFKEMFLERVKHEFSEPVSDCLFGEMENGKALHLLTAPLWRQDFFLNFLDFGGIQQFQKFRIGEEGGKIT